MSSPLENQLSRRERQIMDVVYRLGQATATQILEDLPDPPSKTAVRTILRILEEKGHLHHTLAGQAYLYHPSRPRGQEGKSALARVLLTFFDGSLEKAVAAHLNDETTELTEEELDRLLNLIRRARQGE